MKTYSSSRIGKLVLFTVFSSTIGLTSSASAVDYSALDLGDWGETPPGAYPGATFAGDLNVTGQVTGFSSRFENGLPVLSSFITGPNGVGKTILDTLSTPGFNLPIAINATGQVVGTSVVLSSGDGTAHAFLTGSNGAGITDLGALGRTASVAFGLNDNASVVGASFNETTEGNTPITHAFITGPGGTGIRDLVTPGAPSTSSIATDINANGEAVGVYGVVNENDLGRAFITGPNGMNARDIGTLGGTGSGASAVNDSGRVVGASNTVGTSGADNAHAFITGPNGGGMTDLGALGQNFSSASDINASGQVVGSYGPNIDATRAFVTGPDGSNMSDLSSLVRLPTGVGLAHAAALNDRGQILAFGSNDRAYLLTPGDGSTASSPLFPNFIEEDGWRFEFDTQSGQMFFVDPLVAVGYDYVVNSGPNFQSALFPSVEGDTDGYNVFAFNVQTNTYDISLGHVNPGEVFSFGAGGLSRFALRDIEITAGLDPDNPLAFPTGLTFAETGTVSMMQSPIAVPEPETYALLIAGLGLVGFMARRRAAL